MVSDLYSGEEIANMAKSHPNSKIVRTQTYAEVYQSVVLRYLYDKYFEYDGKKQQWIMHSSNRDKNIKMINGKEIVKYSQRMPNVVCLKTRHTVKTYRQVFEEVFNQHVRMQGFYHRGLGYWCRYDEKRDAQKITNIKKKDYEHPNSLLHKDKKGRPKKVTYKKGTIGETRWDARRNNKGYGGFKRRHMGDGNDVNNKKKKLKGRI